MRGYFACAGVVEGGGFGVEVGAAGGRGDDGGGERAGFYDKDAWPWRIFGEKTQICAGTLVRCGAWGGGWGGGGGEGK